MSELDETDRQILNGEYETNEGASEGDDGPAWAATCRFCGDSFDHPRQETQHRCEGRVTLALGEQDDRGLIVPHGHGFGAKFLFESSNMQAYHGVVATFDNIYQAEQHTFEFGGDTWEVVYDADDGASTTPWTGKIAPREGDTTEDGEGYNEYQIAVRQVEDDGPERRRASFQFRPSYPNMVHSESGEPIQSVPDDLPEGVRVQVNSSNVHHGQVLPLLQAVAESMDLNPSYFTDPHEWSRIYNFEVYTRVERYVTDKLTQSGGVFERLARLSSHQPVKGEYVWDNREIHGWRHAIAMDSDGWQKLIPNHEVGARVKAYHPEHPRSQRGDDDDDPLYYPKVEVQLSSEYNDYTVPWDEREAVRRELEEKLLNSLSWAGVAIAPTPGDDGPFVADDYWTPEYADRSLYIVEDPTEAQIQNEQEFTLGKFMGAEPTRTETTILTAIVEGGRQHYEEIAEAADASIRSVYRAIETFDDVVNNDRGYVEMVDGVIRDQLQGVLEQIRDLGSHAESTVKGLTEDVAALESQSSPIAKWARAHGVNVGQLGSQYEFDLSGVERSEGTLWDIIKAGVEAAYYSDFDTAAFMDAQFRIRTPDDGERVRSFSLHGSRYSFFGPIPVPW